MSATTLYAQVGSKEELMAAAIDSAGAQMGAAMTPAVRRAPDWSSAVRAAIGALFNFLTSRPALARLMLVEAHVAGPFALEPRVGYLEPLARLLAEGREQNPEAPPITSELVAGVFYSLGRKAMREGGAAALPGLAPLCTYLALAPYVGAEEALAAANGDGGRRR
jgi:AcrR family transcriptional regulator